MKKLLVLLGLASSLAINAYSQNNYEKIEVTPESGKVYVMPRQEAEKQMLNLAKTSKVEDAWIYHNGELTDVGIGGTRELILNDSALIHSRNYNPEDTLWHYHIHPQREEDEISPPGELDAFLDRTIRKEVNLKEDQIITSVFDKNYKWTYWTSDIFESNPLYSEGNSFRLNNLWYYMNYYYRESFPNEKVSEEGIENFINGMEEIGFKISYEKMK